MGTCTSMKTAGYKVAEGRVCSGHVSTSSATLHDPNPIGVAVREESMPVHARPSATLYPDALSLIHI